MAIISGYHRPATLEAALTCLARPATVPLGGGTKLNGTAATGPIEVVDLQALGLDRIDRLDGRMAVIGATVTLSQLADSPVVPHVIREAARREQPSTLRAQATVGGCVASRDAESELLAALLAHGAVVRIVAPDRVSELTLQQLLGTLPPPAGGIITAVTVSTAGRSSAARTGRTRADRPIVAAVARITADGRRCVALTGVAAAPVLIGGRDQTDTGKMDTGWMDTGGMETSRLDPPADFRGSAEYRRALAAVLTARALTAIT
ncbi:MAG: FAD binding domain-containing protein [Streptosporangiaceae bacterium]|jgi:CO/xanthine dehydrogenase FAD-binding subunit